MYEWSFVIASYALTWLVIGVYALYLRARGKRARAELSKQPHDAASTPAAER